MVQAISGTLVSEGSISLGGNPGRELKVSPTGPDGVEYLFHILVDAPATRHYNHGALAGSAFAHAKVQVSESNP
jgi:hypothetical protein